MRGKVALTVVAAIVASAGALGLLRGPLTAQEGERFFQAQLNGYQEVPAVSTVAGGSLQIHLIDPNTLQFQLTFAGLEASVTAAHIHLGQPGVAGGVSAFFCGGSTKPACPQSGTVTGTITAADVIGPAGQGISAGEFTELLRAMRNGATYANVHSTTFPTGEIRGQVRPRSERP